MSASKQMLFEQCRIEDFQRWAASEPRNDDVAHTLDLLMADLLRWHDASGGIAESKSLFDSVQRWARANHRADDDAEQSEIFEYLLEKND